MKANEILGILKSVIPAIAKKDLVEQLTHFVFTGMDIFAYNDLICISHPFETGFECSVKARDLYAIMENLGREEVFLSLDGEKNELAIETKSTKAGLVVHTIDTIREQIEILNLDKIEKWNELPKDFIEGIKMSIFSTSSDQTSGILTCLYIENNSIWASDNYRISHYKMENPIEDKILIPALVAKELIVLPITHYSTSESWIYFQTTENLKFAFRKYSGEYDDCNDFFNVSGIKLNLPSSMRDLVQTTSVMSSTAVSLDKQIHIEIKDKKATCSAENERGWIKKTLDIDYDKKRKIKFSTNPDLFLEIIGKCKDMTVGDSCVLFESGAFRHVISLE